MLGLGLLHLVALVIVVVLVGVWRKRSKPKAPEYFLLPDAPKDTVVLHQYGAAPSVPSISPFVMKLETYLRVADIPYIIISSCSNDSVYFLSRPSLELFLSFLLPDAPKDTVVLHQYGAAPSVPSISPFVMKLETYLRVADIPYINKYDRWPGPKEKLPWIQYNNQAVPDSQRCVEFLNQERGVDLNKKLGPGELALGHLLRRTCEESLYWILLMWRLVFDPNATIYNRMSIPKPIIWYMRRNAQGRLWSQGIGRHSEQEVTHMMEEDLAAVSNLIGKNKFLFGDTRDCVTEFDCAVFGQLCQLVWQMPGCSVQETIESKYPNLVTFCENMKTTFWPDWDDRLLRAGRKSSTK
ncbi:failed axon connections [Plakobranchus ocellatus]|uniref:Failed axon connections n=1 Tax=Plakobranchus ocellatus TaxID=259542 RepID=A0AAV3Y9Y8_9GAST|nr:failed axon connections [Plakobranchus ocellatus]